MSEEAKRERFERLVLAHMDAAYGLARWLTRNEAQAEEAVQEAYLRAYRFFHGFRGGDARPWLLGIVRNCCYTLLERERAASGPDEFDEDAHGEDAVAAGAVLNFPANPELAAIESADRELVQRCLRALPDEYREALALRELHDCSYKEIAAIAGIPIGTVMSRLARGRRLLQQALRERMKKEDTGT
ncbi:MAG: sigma-70 family RNA polymerase sigma factor [Betaproteobacteria bacterium]|nr:sigma-70 family RNA polymerase sigma factor [Betaproteobacteria bacterium]